MITRHNQIGNSGSELGLNDFADLSSWVELAHLGEGHPSPMVLGYNNLVHMVSSFNFIIGIVILIMCSKLIACLLIYFVLVF